MSAVSTPERRAVSSHRYEAVRRLLTPAWVSVQTIALIVAGDPHWHQERSRREQQVRDQLGRLLLAGVAEREPDPWTHGWRWRAKTARGAR